MDILINIYSTKLKMCFFPFIVVTLSFFDNLPTEEVKFIRELRRDYGIDLPLIPYMDYSHLVGNIYLHQTTSHGREPGILRHTLLQGDDNGNLTNLREEMLLELMRLKIIMRRHPISSPDQLEQVINGFVVSEGHIVGIGFAYLNLEELPESIGNVPHLRVLTAINTHLTRLPKSITQLKELHTLELSNNNLDTLPEEINELINLRNLNLSHNGMNSIPNLHNLHSLQKIDMSSNNLTVIPSNLSGLSNLTNMDFGYNRIIDIPDSIRSITKLITLDLAHNQITELPDGIGSLFYLNRLNLSENLISYLPHSCNKFLFLESLRMDGNQLHQIPDCIQYYRRLFELDLSNNMIQRIPDWINTLKNLRVLQLQNNMIQNLPFSVCELKLQTLDLGNNRIAKVPEVISNMQDLETLNLANNAFMDIPNELYYLPKQTEIIIHGCNSRIDLLLSQYSDPNAVHAYLSSRFEAYMRWSPNSVLVKLENDEGLSDVDRNYPYLGKYAGFFLERLSKYNNHTALELRRLLDEHYSIHQNDFDLLL